MILLVFLISCSTAESEKAFDLQGHRGARGLAPENSLPGFKLAAELGVNTLELDLVVSGDGQLVVSHEPYFSPHFCLDNTGGDIPEDSIINIYQLTYDQIKQYDCGSKGNVRFPDQRLTATYKPLLSEVIDSVQSLIEKNNRDAIYYNIELKTQVATDLTFHPTPSSFSDLVYKLLEEKKILDRVTIQSFDFRTLQYFHGKYPDVKLALLIENQVPWNLNIDSLGFTPDIYSCYYQLLSQEIIEEIQNSGMDVIPWTVNETREMEELINWGVDGIITDYPDRTLQLINNR